MSSQDNNKSNLLLPNTTQTPNVFYDEYMALLTPEEWKVLCYTIRRIYGFQRTQDHIALSQYTDGATLRDGKLRDRGTGLSRPTVVDALDSLVEYGLIIRLEKNDRPRDGALYKIQLDYDKIDLSGLIERDRLRVEAEQQRAEKSRKTREANKAKRLASQAGGREELMPFTDIGKSGLPEELTPFTDTGKPDLPEELTPFTDIGKPGLLLSVNGVYTQNQEKPRETKKETKEEEEAARAAAGHQASASQPLLLPPIPYPKTAKEAKQHPDLQIYERITGIFPGQADYRRIIDAIQLIRCDYLADQELENHLRVFWDAWCSRKRKDGKPYDKRSLAWLEEWAVNNDIPDDPSAAGAAQPPIVPKASSIEDATRKMLEEIQREQEREHALLFGERSDCNPEWVLPQPTFRDRTEAVSTAS